MCRAAQWAESEEGQDEGPGRVRRKPGATSSFRLLGFCIERSLQFGTCICGDLPNLGFPILELLGVCSLGASWILYVLEIAESRPLRDCTVGLVRIECVWVCVYVPESFVC